MKVVILGRGKVGSSLAFALRGHDVRLVSSRHAAPRDADTLILAVPDAMLRPLAERLAPERGTVVLHCAGARGPEELAALREHGAHVAGFHPLVSFANKRTQLGNRTFVVDGDPKAVRRARAIARLVNAHCVARPVLGPAYHAAAALVANGGVALVHAGVRVLLQLGIQQRAAEQALAGLLQSVADNVRSQGVPAALTGPVRRGDAETVARHLAALAPLGLARAYASVQPLVLESAREAGLSAGEARLLEAVISRSSRAPRARELPRPPRTRATPSRARRPARAQARKARA